MIEKVNNFKSFVSQQRIKQTTQKKKKALAYCFPDELMSQFG